MVTSLHTVDTKTVLVKEERKKYMNKVRKKKIRREDNGKNWEWEINEEEKEESKKGKLKS